MATWTEYENGKDWRRELSMRLADINRRMMENDMATAVKGTFKYLGDAYRIFNINDLRADRWLDELRALTEGERSELKSSIDANGIMTPLVINETNTIIDGHNRYAIAKELELQEIPVCIITGMSDDETREFIWKKQLGRRNLAQSERDELLGKMMESRKKRERGGGDMVSEGAQERKAQNEPNAPMKVDTAQEIADEFGVSKATVKRAASRVRFEEDYPYFKELDAPTAKINELKKEFMRFGEDEREKIYVNAEGAGASVEQTIVACKLVRLDILPPADAIDSAIADIRDAQKEVEDTIATAKRIAEKPPEQTLPEPTGPVHPSGDLSKPVIKPEHAKNLNEFMQKVQENNIMREQIRKIDLVVKELRHDLAVEGLDTSKGKWAEPFDQIELYIALTKQ